MIKLTIYLQNGRTISAYLRKRQYDYLTGILRKETLKIRIKKFFRKLWPWSK